jgi:hypothetical protein
MSDLREQLQAMQHEYAAEKYPGDLASDVLRPRHAALFRIGAIGLALTGIAAAVVVWIGTQNAPPAMNPQASPPQQVALAPQDAPNTQAVADATEHAVDFPTDSPLTGSGTLMSDESLMPASSMSLEMPVIPSISSFDTDLSTNAATTKESV